jgi:hypothetical protein
MSTGGSELLPLLLGIMRLWNWPLIILTPSTPCLRYVLFVYQPLPFHFLATVSLLVLIVSLTYLCIDPSIPCFTSTSSRERTYSGGSSCCFV